MADSKKRILVVEDERPLAHALELKLQHEGFVVVVASNGREGLDILDKEQFDVIILDLMMPEVDGFQVLERLRSHPRAPKAIVLSNLSQQEDEKRVLSLGASKFFIKSNTPLTTIVEAVRNT